MSTHLHFHTHPEFPLRGFALMHPYALEWLLLTLWAAILLLVWLGAS